MTIDLGLEKLQVLVPEKHDLVLMKTVRGQDNDLEAIDQMAQRVGLDMATLVDRFRDEMTHVICPPERLRANFLSVIEMIYGESEADRELLQRLRPEEALEIARRSVDIDATYFLSHHSVGETAWKTGRRDEAIAALERAHALAPWFSITNGWLAAAYRLAGRDDRAEALLATMGPTARPFWGRVIYHLLLSELDEAADWYQRMIDERDPFALVYACEDYAEPLRAHPRWRRLSELMKLPG